MSRKSYYKKWREENREKFRQYAKDWSRENKLRRNEISLNWRKNNSTHMKNLYRKNHLAKYGLTSDEFANLLTKQENRCAMPSCRTSNPGGNGNQWAIDHDHSNGKVRGLLCFKCNIALGFYEKNKTRHEEFDSYLGDKRIKLCVVRGGLEG